MFENHTCPRCGVEMEPIETGEQGPPLQQLQLCPGCYLVMWSDEDSQRHLRQGVPMKKGAGPGSESFVAGEPEEC